MYLEYLYSIKFQKYHILEIICGRKLQITYSGIACVSFGACLARCYFMHCSLIYGVIRVYACHTPNYVHSTMCNLISFSCVRMYDVLFFLFVMIIIKEMLTIVLVMCFNCNTKLIQGNVL